MALEEIKKKKKKSHRDHGDTRASKSRKKSDDDDRATTKSSAALAADRPPDIETLRKARLENLAKTPEQKRKEMKYEYVKSTKAVSQTGGDRDRKYRIVRDHSPDLQHSKSSPKPTKRTDDMQKRMRRDDGESDYVYGRPDNTRKNTATKYTTKSQSKASIRGLAPSTVRRQIPERRNTEPIRRRPSDEGRDAERERRDTERATSRQQRDTQSSPTMVRRSTVSADKPQRPPLKRNATTSSRSKVDVGASKVTHPNDGQKSTVGKLSGMFLPNSEPQKKVSCLTCGADDVPVLKSAKLPCSHRMCHSCLKRIFTMSVKDPAHMPPRCCTDQHIDLKHVDRLFDQKFKVLWNRKYDEFKTKNRIYCPARRCGAWIKPHHMKIEDGRKVGRCKQCKTRVCGICSQKMHVSRDCPKDPEMKALAQVAREKGWQRCYNCSAMVELKEGCNHMTCRCTAEFCMICGLKWKSCDCPWFNYQAVDAHLGGDPVRYQEEMDRRRDQVERDEALARRMQQLGLGNDAERDEFGNAANHHMNGNFIQQAREALTANYAQAGQAARDLINGLVMGRENNRTPGMPLPMEQMLEMLGQRGGARDPAEEGQGEHNGRRPGRRGTARRRRTAQEADGGEQDAYREADEERRIRDWANSVPA
ncbi:uncharacterized protein PV06_10388 [Exophiala oligosperma]|uniref:RBR-type E3 ubiquitin transferase n=1 Tax=Exophiala oligosperma TaxID=215243 RepID=A0A0D2AAE9_9EURO|nr:uncharacterized protein PV06_10388 [Exophiala oligosperma]KIW37341.1 hypothetical protein PV06_10388 [Exophiala oligosperma]